MKDNIVFDRKIKDINNLLNEIQLLEKDNELDFKQKKKVFKELILVTKSLQTAHNVYIKNKE